jgi:hypothetical protein
MMAVGFALWVFLAQTWMPNGDPMPTLSRGYATAAECNAARAQFMNEAQGINDQDSSAMQMGWHADPCHVVFSDNSARKP